MGAKSLKRSMCEVEQKLSLLGYPLDRIKEICEEKRAITKYAYIVHDKDVVSQEEIDKGYYTRDRLGTPKDPHVHIMLHFDYSQEFKHVAQWFGVPEQQVAKCQTWGGAIRYLTHSNDVDIKKGKHRYEDSEVVANFDWVPDSKIHETKGDKKLDSILEKIESGEIREFNLSQYVTVNEYNEYKSKIRNAFEYVYNKLDYEGMKGSRNMNVMFITGATGSGKSTYAKKICNDMGYSYFVSDGGKNPLDGYGGQDAVILDDLRPSDYKYNELLKLLDNHTSSRVACRYYNKSMRWCKLLIITSIMPIDTWYEGLQRDHDDQIHDPIGQLKRRCGGYVVMNKDTIVLNVYSDLLGDYEPQVKMKNTVIDQYRKEATQKKVDMFKQMLGVTEDAEDLHGFHEVPEYLKLDIPFEKGE